MIGLSLSPWMKSVNIGRGWSPEEDLPGLYAGWSCHDLTTLWQDTGGTTQADASGEAVARWDAVTNRTLRGVSATTRIPVLGAYGTELGILFDTSDDRLEFQATCANMLQNRTSFSMSWSMKLVDLASSFKRLCYVSNNSGLTRFNLVQTHDAAGDIPNTTIRRVDGSASAPRNFPNLAAYEERVYGLSYNAANGELRWYENGILMDSADFSGTLGDGSFSNLASTQIYLGESSGATYFDWWVGVNAVWTAGEFLALADTSAQRSGQ